MCVCVFVGEEGGLSCLKPLTLLIGIRGATEGGVERCGWAIQQSPLSVTAKRRSGGREEESNRVEGEINLFLSLF